MWGHQTPMQHFIQVQPPLLSYQYEIKLVYSKSATYLRWSLDLLWVSVVLPTVLRSEPTVRSCKRLLAIAIVHTRQHSAEVSTNQDIRWLQGSFVWRHCSIGTSSVVSMQLFSRNSADVKLICYENMIHGFLSMDMPGGLEECSRCVKDSVNCINELIRMNSTWSTDHRMPLLILIEIENCTHTVAFLGWYQIPPSH